MADVMDVEGMNWLVGVRCAASLCGWEAESDEYLPAEREAIQHMEETGHDTIMEERRETTMRLVAERGP